MIFFKYFFHFLWGVFYEDTDSHFWHEKVKYAKKYIPLSNIWIFLHLNFPQLFNVTCCFRNNGCRYQSYVLTFQALTYAEGFRIQTGGPIRNHVTGTLTPIKGQTSSVILLNYGEMRIYVTRVPTTLLFMPTRRHW